MSVYKDQRTGLYVYEFQIKKRRFKGPTGKSTESEAASFEKVKRREAEHEIELGIIEKNTPMTLASAVLRYYDEWGQHQGDAPTMSGDCESLIQFFGESMLLKDLTNSEVTRLIIWRQKQYRWGKKEYGLLSNARVNRSTWQLLSRVCTRAIDFWNIKLPNVPNWKQFRLKEPKRRERLLSQSEFNALLNAIDPEYRVVFLFALATGLRQASSLLEWKNVSFERHSYSYIGKGGHLNSKPMTPGTENVFRLCQGHHPDYVFTFLTKRERYRQWKRGERRPITTDGLKSHWVRLKTKLGIADLRWHDLRRTFATVALETTQNLALVQRLLDHADPKTTLRYAVVRDEQMRSAIVGIEDAIFKGEFGVKTPQIAFQPEIVRAK